MPTITTAATARDLLAALGDRNPGVEEGNLVFALDPPAGLEPLLSILHTGVRAVLTRRTWYGCDGETGRVYELNPAAPLPPGITLLCVAGDKLWDRVHPAARADHPHLFARARTAGPSKPGSKTPPSREPSGDQTHFVSDTPEVARHAADLDP